PAQDALDVAVEHRMIQARPLGPGPAPEAHRGRSAREGRLTAGGLTETENEGKVLALPGDETGLHGPAVHVPGPLDPKLGHPVASLLDRGAGADKSEAAESHEGPERRALAQSQERPERRALAGNSS